MFTTIQNAIIDPRLFVFLFVAYLVVGLVCQLQVHLLQAVCDETKKETIRGNPITSLFTLFLLLFLGLVIAITMKSLFNLKEDVSDWLRLLIVLTPIAILLVARYVRLAIWTATCTFINVNGVGRVLGFIWKVLTVKI